MEEQPSGLFLIPDYPPSKADFGKFSHLGGFPSLPTGTDWPRNPDGKPIHFLGQINLSDLPKETIVDHLDEPIPNFPTSGALYFFIDCEGFNIWEKPETSHQVIYYSGTVTGLKPTSAPADLPAHNGGESGTLANTHAPYFVQPDPRPLILLPHVPLSFKPASMLTGSPHKDGWPQPVFADWTKVQHGKEYSHSRLFETAFPWRWLMLERIALSILNIRPSPEPDWLTTVRVRALKWAEQASAFEPQAIVPDTVGSSFRAWLIELAPLDSYCMASAINEGMGAAWPYVVFGGDECHLPPELVNACRPIVSPNAGSGHKMFGSGASVQGVAMTDEYHMLLLRLESDLALDFCWGDAGVLQFSMRMDDLVARNFDRTLLNADCH